jgi:creatinine amidohydrolase/Fe(II)-dependent formamide hydrolase-like protein
MVRKYKIEEMTPEELRKAVSEFPAFIVPTGIVEWHGEHLPLGLMH